MELYCTTCMNINESSSNVSTDRHEMHVGNKVPLKERLVKLGSSTVAIRGIRRHYFKIEPGKIIIGKRPPKGKIYVLWLKFAKWRRRIYGKKIFTPFSRWCRLPSLAQPSATVCQASGLKTGKGSTQNSEEPGADALRGICKPGRD